VAAAYIVFFALILIYVAIMAMRLGRVEREIGDMLERVGDDPLAAEHARLERSLALSEQSEAEPLPEESAHV
jgi:hypothetical protein